MSTPTGSAPPAASPLTPPAVPALEGAHVLITGGAGFIGSHLVERLAGRNRVRVLDILRRDALRPAGLDKLPGVELMVGVQ